jgi:hypothetical protein
MFAVLVRQRKIRGVFTDLCKLIVDGRLCLAGLWLGNYAYVLEPVRILCRTVDDQVRSYLGTGYQIIPQPVVVDGERHRHRIHVPLDRFVIDGSFFGGFIDGDYFTF